MALIIRRILVSVHITPSVCRRQTRSLLIGRTIMVIIMIMCLYSCYSDNVLKMKFILRFVNKYCKHGK